jgi:hypothetical protein
VCTCMDLQCIFRGVYAKVVNILNYKVLDERTTRTGSSLLALLQILFNLKSNMALLYGCDTWSLTSRERQIKT